MATFNIIQNGSWPTETYSVYLSTSVLNPLVPFYPAKNYFSFIHNPHIKLNDLIGSSYKDVIYDYSKLNSTYGLSQIKEDSSLVWNLSSQRKTFKYGSTFNYFSVRTNPGSDDGFANNSSYLLYPTHLILYPLSLVKEEDGWVVTASSVLVQSNSYTFDGSNPEIDGYKFHQKYLNLPETIHIPVPTSSGVSLIYSLSASHVKQNIPILLYSDSDPSGENTVFNYSSQGLSITPTPKYKAVLPEKYPSTVRLNSCFVSYSLNYQGLFGFSTAKQTNPGEESTNYQGFGSNFVTNFSLLSSTNQVIFQMVQAPSSAILPIYYNDMEHNICVTNINLSSGLIEFYSDYTYNYDNSSYIPRLSGSRGSYIGFSYIADSNYFLNGESYLSSLVYFKSNNLDASLNQPIVSTENNLISWKTAYPPHYYSYKVAAIAPSLGLNSLIDSNDLDFTLRFYTEYKSITSLVINPYIGSDHDTLGYSLSAHTLDDEYFSLKVAVPNSYKLPDIILSDTIKFFTGPSADELAPYDIQTSPFVPAKSASYIYITYPFAVFGDVDFVLNATLSSSRGLLNLSKPQPVHFAEGLVSPLQGNPIFIEKITEGPGFIVATSRLLTSENTFPNRDLLGTPISWAVLPQDIPVIAQSVSIDDGTVVGELKTDVSYSFDDFSSTVKFSNLGNRTATIYLSSQKYNEVASLVYDPSKIIFQRNLKIINSSYLNNFEKTRIITLTAGEFLDENLTPLSPNTQIAWRWKYNNVEDAAGKYIKVYYGSEEQPIEYSFGQAGASTQLSSIYVAITPAEDKVCNIIPVTFYIETVGDSPSLKANFLFAVDSFPGKDVFNVDFFTTYRDYFSIDKSTSICDTNLNQLYFLRPQGDTNSYTFFATPRTLPTNILLSEDTTGKEEFAKINETVEPFNQALAIWSVDDNTGYSEVLSEGMSATYTIRPGATATNITFEVLYAIVPGWLSNIPEVYKNPVFLGPWHNFKKSITIYTLPEEYFKPLEFILFPEKQWLSGSKINILGISDYSLSQANTGYKESLSNSQTYWISANKEALDYDVYIGSNKTHLSAFDSNVFKVNLPFTPEYLATTGLQIHLDAYSGFVSPESDLFYKIPLSGQLVTKIYELTAHSYNPTLSSNSLKTNPTLISYFSYPTLSFSLNTLSAALEYNRDVYITQNFNISPENTPALPLFNLGSITYLVSSFYWKSYITVPSVSGIQKAFTLQVGDPYDVGFVSPQQISQISIQPVSMEIPFQIPESTFSNYSLTEYPANLRDSWKIVPKLVPIDYISPSSLVAYSSSITPKIYVSNFITTTDNPITIIYDAAGETPDNKITLCKTWFNDSGRAVYSQKNNPISINFSSPGTFYLNYDIYYQDGKRITGISPNPIVVYENWPTLNISDIRTLNEIELILPYNLEQIEIQPNEWGFVDIFNTALARLYDNLEYLRNNSQTVDTKFPSINFGWLGTNVNFKSEGIRWYTKGLNDSDYLSPGQANASSATGLAINEGINYFENIKDVAIIDNYYYILDNNKLRCFINNGFRVSEVIFDNLKEINEEFIEPTGIEINEDGTILYINDPPRNKIIQLSIDLKNNLLYSQISVGGYGSLKESNKFNSPSQIVYADQKLFVLDSGNFCIKEYSDDLNWTHTYFTEEFELDNPVAIAANSSSQLKNLLYVFSSQYNLYIFDKNNSKPILKIYLKEIYDNLPKNVFRVTENIFKIIFDLDGEFLYFISSNHIFKYTISGAYIGNILVRYSITSIIPDVNKHLMLSTPWSIVRMQDVTTLFKIGAGLPTNYWGLDQILIKPQEFAEDKTYNKALSRITDNILMFRNSLNSQFKKIISTAERLEYFAIYPISVADRPIFEKDVENNNVKIGVNELHIPQVLNRELVKLYNSLQSLADFLKITELNFPTIKIEGIGSYVECPEPFCWSWKATSNFNLQMPSMRICGVNPITYAELDPKFPVSYAPSKQWKDAISDCCNKTPIYVR